ncbi:MAG: hypothetical protein ACJ71Q_17440 [Terriglobales bacterium]|jgi:hypothetical protein
MDICSVSLLFNDKRELGRQLIYQTASAALPHNNPDFSAHLPVSFSDVRASAPGLVLWM